MRRAKGEMREKDRELGDLRLEVAAKEKEAQQLRTSSELTGRCARTAGGGAVLEPRVQHRARRSKLHCTAFASGVST